MTTFITLTHGGTVGTMEVIRLPIEDAQTWVALLYFALVL